MIEDMSRIMERNLCDHCLGRSYSQLLHGHSNDERGRALRVFMAMMVDSSSLDYSRMDMNNFYGLAFNQNKKIEPKREKCWLCNNLFDSIDSMASKVARKLASLEFKDFLVGSKVPDDILDREEKLWENLGVKYVESIKSEINRELGKRLGRMLDKPSNFRNPEVVVLADFAAKSVSLQVNSMYILGFYQKLVRGIPQSKWGTPGRYKTSIQEEIAKPFLRVTKASASAFHGMGREDVDARCLGWRPFVIEIVEPRVRKVSLTKMRAAINKSRKVRVKGLRLCDRFTVVRLKSERGDKTYRVTVEFDKPVSRKDLVKIKRLKGSISQQTPTRVVHRRADLNRRRVVKEIRYRVIGKKRIEIVVRTNAGLYVKELVSGDSGRTRPSVAEILNVKATPKDLDVVQVECPKNL